MWYCCEQYHTLYSVFSLQEKHAVSISLPYRAELQTFYSLFACYPNYNTMNSFCQGFFCALLF